MRFEQWSWAATLCLAACGGAGSGSGGAVTVTIASTAALDGGGVYDADGSRGVFTVGGNPGVGDFDFFLRGRRFRMFVSFDRSAIPAGATVTSAEFRINQASVFGTPYATHGTVVADHVDYGSSLTVADLDLPPIEPVEIPVSSDAAVGYKAVDVTAFVQGDVADGRTRTQFRLRFDPVESDGDATNDRANFEDGEGSCCAPGPYNPPLLVITYVP
jgi:hypothetical protein